MKTEIHKGSTVKHKDGWYVVSAKFKNTVNLMTIFYGRVVLKKVPLNEVEEDYDNWYQHWSESESYKCM